MLFIVCGLPGAGKTTISKDLAMEYGLIHIEVSDLIKRLLLGISVNASYDEFVKQTLYSRQKVRFAAEVAAELRGTQHSTAVVSGFRTIGEIQYLKEQYSSIVIYLECPYDMRLKRKLESSFLSPFEFSRRTELDISYGTEKIRELADLVVLNMKTPADCVAEITARLSK